MDGLIAEHRSRQNAGGRKPRNIQRSMEATIDTAWALEFKQWVDDPPEMVERINAVGSEIRMLEALPPPGNRRGRRARAKKLGRLKFLLDREIERLGYWRWNKEQKLYPLARRVWHKFYCDD